MVKEIAWDEALSNGPKNQYTGSFLDQVTFQGDRVEAENVAKCDPGNPT
jgi:hypothetical protein